MNSEATKTSEGNHRAWLVLIAALIAAGLLYLYFESSQPPCASCHVEYPPDGFVPAPGNGPDDTKPCRLVGRIRWDWSLTFGEGIYANFGLAEISTTYPGGHHAGDCIDIPIACPPKDGLTPPPVLVFHGDDPGDPAWINPLCPDCRSCR